ncbi:MAG: T9SS type A sorting domain-containing protein, partial [Bacteroidales bacterium]|nr:T9SS type A sorting domain-containing protein [Bacteroidales bacterium]
GQIKIELSSPTTVEVIDIQGRTILQQQTDSCVVFIDLKGTQSGVYFVKANGLTEKIVLE